MSTTPPASPTMISAAKRQRTVSPVSSASKLTGSDQVAAAVDVSIRTLFPTSAETMLGCVELNNAPNLSMDKSYGLSIIVVADVSGSMVQPGSIKGQLITTSRIENLRGGVLRLGELVRQYSGTTDADFTLISFNTNARILQGPGPVPSAEKMIQLCANLRPEGCTDIGKALKLACEVSDQRVMLGRSVHIVLFTDGEDSVNLPERVHRFNAGNDCPESALCALKAYPLQTLHCVAICAEADTALLDSIAKIARRGTFQMVSEAGIAALMGSLWGLVLEMVDYNVVVQIVVDDKEVVEKEVILRLCTPPMPCRIPFKVVAGAAEIHVEVIFTCDVTKHVNMALPRAAEPGVDIECALEAVSLIQAKADSKMAEALGRADYDTAGKAVASAIAKTNQLHALATETMTDGSLDLTEAVTSALALLNIHVEEIERSRVDANVMRDAQARAYSRASTNRANGVSIDPGAGRTQSDLQRNLSAV